MMINVGILVFLVFVHEYNFSGYEYLKPETYSQLVLCWLLIKINY